MRQRKLLAALMAIAMSSLIAIFAAGCSDSGQVTAPTSNDDELNFPVPETQQTEAGLDQQASEVEAQFAKAANWTPISGPTTITQSGYYRVTSDFSASDDAIMIQADHVYLQMHGHTITGPGNKAGRGVVVDGANAVYIYGGSLENFGLGVQMINSSHVYVVGVKVTGGDEFADPANGVAPQIGIMSLNSNSNFIYANHLSLVNLGIFIRGDGSYNNVIYRNFVTGGDRGLLAVCYNPDGSGDPAAGHNDLIIRNFLDRFGLGLQFKAMAHDNRFLANVVYYFNSPWEDLNGSNQIAYNRTRQLQSPMMSNLTLNFNGIEDLGPNFQYEGWIIVDGHPISTGRFTVDGSGMMSQTDFPVLTANLMDATKFVLTIEPEPDSDPGPSMTHYLAGDFSGSSAGLSVSDPAALGSDFSSAMGEYILATPSTGSDMTDYAQGIWWLNPNPSPAPTLTLPTLPPGWMYEGWVVGSGGPVTTGKFTSVTGADSDGKGPTAGPDGFPPFPGQDFISPAMNLIGDKAVITIEPDADNSSAPFTLKPLVDGNIEDVGRGVPQSMSNNAGSFPTGMATR